MATLAPVTVPSFLDCQSCGACCCNTARNRADGTHEYVVVEPDDRLQRERRDLLRTLAVRNAAGQWHLRLVGDDERCVALQGAVGVDVTCGIYALRPRGCRVVQPGDDECLRARRHRAVARTGEA
ncbi:MAG: YkgJ family cysteine cluster protein [Deltaproteobacteria bacterium]|nr:YkgJ family cysteine cluster protein [Deltaproteobacteria bacterium]